MGRRERATIAVATLVFALGATGAEADRAADRCAGAKLKAVGTYGKAVLTCEAVALVRETGVDPGCTGRALEKLADAFFKAEGRGGCVTAEDSGEASALVDADVAELLAAIPGGDDSAARRCAASKWKATGRHYASVMGCYSKAAKGSKQLQSSCPAKADVKLAKAFAKGEATGGCETEGDDGTAADWSESAVTALVETTSPACGDSVVGPGQVCDGGSDAACPGYCTVACECALPPVCGNGSAELPEECDDGGSADGDGCSAACLLEDLSALCHGVATQAGTDLALELVTDALDAPVHATAPPLDPSRLFVVEQAGRILIVDLESDTLQPTPFLDIRGIVGDGGERGLLSMAFDPDFENNRRFFVNYTNNSGDTTIARYEASATNADVADGTSARVLLVIDQPFANHNGGQIAFGADGYLYVGMGDGGGGGDPIEAAQDDASLLGKMLRMDVSVDAPPYYAVPVDNPGYAGGSDPIELVWAKGLRNPWRFSFDRATGDLLIGDVGQNAIEEINWQSGASTGGENYGWDIFEADTCFEPDPAPTCPDPATGFTMPIAQYGHGQGCSVDGGFVYRGCSRPELAGTYFYSDYCSSFVRTFEILAGAAVNPLDRTGEIDPDGAGVVAVASFGEDARGELYLVDIAGSLFRFVAP